MSVASNRTPNAVLGLVAVIKPGHSHRPCSHKYLTSKPRLCTMTSIPFTDSRWTPLSKQHRLEGESNKDGSELKSVTVGGTDWWRTTERDSHDGPTLGFRRPIGEGFEVSVELDVEAKTQVSGNVWGHADDYSSTFGRGQRDALGSSLTVATKPLSSCMSARTSGSRRASSTITASYGTPSWCATPTLTGE